MSFDKLGLLPNLLGTLKLQGYLKPTPIQAKAIPVILAGRDVLAGAQTGTGKTAAFTLPILQLLEQSGGTSRRPRSLVLVPTRELAAQIGESILAYGENAPLRSTVIYGGVSIRPQIEKLRKGVDIVVATPGRLLDHIGQRTLNLSEIEILVLDEADRMLDMGFIHDIRRILKLLPKKRQNLLFSATYTDEIKRLADGLLHNPELIEVARRSMAAETVSQVVHPVGHNRKRELLSYLIKRGNWNQILIFTRTKHGANRLTKQLLSDGVSATAIHGNKSQAARTKALNDFKKWSVQALVATDIAARGLDIDGLPHVVNFDLPHVPEDYVHRIGRTGRAGSSGVALSLVCENEKKLLLDIERLLKRKITKEVVPGFQMERTVLDSKISGLPPQPGKNFKRSFSSRRTARRMSAGQRSRQGKGHANASRP